MLLEAFERRFSLDKPSRNRFAKGELLWLDEALF